MTEVAVYKIENTLNGRLYFGITCDPARRWRQHVKAAPTQNWALSRAIAKYGVDVFELSVIHWCISREDACELEQFLISEVGTQHNGYNISPGGDGFHEGVVFTAEHKRKIAESRRGMVFSTEHRANLAAAKQKENHPQYGTKRSKATRAKIAAKLTGIKRAPDSEDTRLKRSEAQKMRRQREREARLATTVEI